MDRLTARRHVRSPPLSRSSHCTPYSHRFLSPLTRGKHCTQCRQPLKIATFIKLAIPVVTKSGRPSASIPSTRCNYVVKHVSANLSTPRVPTILDMPAHSDSVLIPKDRRNVLQTRYVSSIVAKYNASKFHRSFQVLPTVISFVAKLHSQQICLYASSGLSTTGLCRILLFICKLRT